MSNNVSGVLVADIKRNALDDGPGIRTTLFSKGCHLSCVWCQNPETKSPKQELLYDSKSCIGCGNCMKACEQAAIAIQSDGVYPVDKLSCILCGKCVSACPVQAIRFAGRHYEVDELCNKLLQDAIFFKHSGGGVTFSGGEPTFHLDFISIVAANLKQRGTHLCLETCGLYNHENFKAKLLPFLDLVYFDIKIFDGDKHKKYCGVPNAGILENFKLLIKEASVNVLPRIPLIPDITTDTENLLAIKNFLQDCGINKVGLLPYNPLWLSKPSNTKETALYTRNEWMSKEEREAIKEIFKGFVFRNF